MLDSRLNTRTIASENLSVMTFFTKSREYPLIKGVVVRHRCVAAVIVIAYKVKTAGNFVARTKASAERRVTIIDTF